MLKKIICFLIAVNMLNNLEAQKKYDFKPFQPPVSYADADKRADEILAKLA